MFYVTHRRDGAPWSTSAWLFFLKNVSYWVGLLRGGVWTFFLAVNSASFFSVSLSASLLSLSCSLLFLRCAFDFSSLSSLSLSLSGSSVARTSCKKSHHFEKMVWKFVQKLMTTLSNVTNIIKLLWRTMFEIRHISTNEIKGRILKKKSQAGARKVAGADSLARLPDCGLVAKH